MARMVPSRQSKYFGACSRRIGGWRFLPGAGFFKNYTGQAIEVGFWGVTRLDRVCDLWAHFAGNGRYGASKSAFETISGFLGPRIWAVTITWLQLVAPWVILYFVYTSSFKFPSHIQGIPDLNFWVLDLNAFFPSVETLRQYGNFQEHG